MQVYNMIKAAITATKHIESPAENGASHNREGGPRSSISLDRTQPTEVESGAGIMEPLPSARLVRNSSNIFLSSRPLIRKHRLHRASMQKSERFFRKSGIIIRGVPSDIRRRRKNSRRDMLQQGGHSKTRRLRLDLSLRKTKR